MTLWVLCRDRVSLHYRYFVPLWASLLLPGLNEEFIPTDNVRLVVTGSDIDFPLVWSLMGVCRGGQSTLIPVGSLQRLIADLRHT